MSGRFHVGDNINMYGNHNTGKVVGNPPAKADSKVVWSEPVVFINYRSSDEMGAAAIEAELVHRLGIGAVFRDLRMRPGIEFPRELLDRAAGCKVMLSIIGEKWDDAHGLRLLGDDSDWVRREIATALAHGVQVVPVLVGARGRLVPDDLPEDIGAIAWLQAPHLRRGYDTEDIRKLVDELLRDLPVLALLASAGWPKSSRST